MRYMQNFRQELTFVVSLLQMKTRVRVHEIVMIAIVRITYIGIAISIRVREVRLQVTELPRWQRLDAKGQLMVIDCPL